MIGAYYILITIEFVRIVKHAMSTISAVYGEQKEAASWPPHFLHIVLAFYGSGQARVMIGGTLVKLPDQFPKLNTPLRVMVPVASR